jgi:hypothetical protein
MEGAKADVECLRQMLGVNWACTATYYEAGLDESGSTLTSRSSIRFTEVLNDNHRWELTGVQSDVRGVLGQLRAHLLRREDAGGRQILVIERVDFSRGYVAAVIGFVDGPSLEVSGRFIDSSGRIGKFSMKRTT